MLRKRQDIGYGIRIEHIAGKTCRIWTCGHDGSVIYWGTARRDDNEETAVAELLKEMTKGKSWTLVAYEVEHWNQDFSPWAVPSVFGQEEFTGGAKETMDWLIDQCIPFVEGNLTTDCSARLIGGYSLAGLFSLFTFYESGEFNGRRKLQRIVMVSGMERICAAPACAGTKRYVFQPRTKGRKDAQPENGCCW